MFDHAVADGHSADYVTQLNNNVNPAPAQCMYVGDAAGRAAGWKAGRKKDFSCSDRKFAANVGIAFHTPEEFFLDEAPAAFDWDGLDPRSIASAEHLSDT